MAGPPERPHPRPRTAPDAVLRRVWGAEDTLSPVAEAEKIKAGSPGSRIEVIPRAGHLSDMENPEPWNAALAAFLTELLEVAARLRGRSRRVAFLAYVKPYGTMAVRVPDA